MPMKQLSPRLRDGAIGGLADEVVGEIVGVVADRPHEAAPLQFAESREQFGGVERAARARSSGVKARPLAAAQSSTSRAVFRSRASWPAITASMVGPGSASPRAMGAGQLQREQRIALALGEDARAVQRGIDQAHKLDRLFERRGDRARSSEAASRATSERNTLDAAALSSISPSRAAQTMSRPEAASIWRAT